MTRELELLKKRLEDSPFLEDIFGTDIVSSYRFLVKVCHPDVCKEDEASQVFNLLTNLKKQADASFLLGNYGKRLPRFKVYDNLVVKLGSVDYTLKKTLGSGITSTVYEIDSSVRFCKIPRTPSNNDLIQNEFDVLKHLWKLTGNDSYDKFVEIQREYVPKPLDIFSTVNESSEKRLVSMYGMNNLTHYSITNLLKQPKYREGIDLVHTFWIIRRLLMTLHLAHSKGYVHGGINPDHVLVCPVGHGLTLIGWTTTAKIGEQSVPILDSKNSTYVSPELKKKAIAHATTDSFSVAQVFFTMVGKQKLPHDIKKYFVKSLESDPSLREQSAFSLHEEFGKLLKSNGFTGYHHMEI